MNRWIKSNPELCIGCRTCMIACVVAHGGKDIFEMEPDYYNFHPRLVMYKTVSMTTTVQCHHCENAPCVEVCPVGALYHDTDRIGIDRDRCIGCHQCVHACPFGAVRMVTLHDPEGKPTRTVAHKCDLCEGCRERPACASVCPTGALTVVTGDELEAAVDRKREATAEQMQHAAQLAAATVQSREAK